MAVTPLCLKPFLQNMHLIYIRHLSHGSVMFCRQERQGDLKIALLGKAEHGTLDHTWIVLLRGLSLFWPLAFADIKALSNHVFEEETQHPVSTGTPEETHSVNSGT